MYDLTNDAPVVLFTHGSASLWTLWFWVFTILLVDWVWS